MFDMKPIGIVHSPRKDLSDDFWGAVEVEIVLDEAFGEEALYGLGDFSHVEVLFLMDQVDPAKVETGARHPRGRADWPLVGIFAQRGKARPNRIGLARRHRAGGRARAACAWSRCSRRHADIGHQALDGGICPDRSDPPARLGDGTDAGLFQGLSLWPRTSTPFT